MNKDDIHERLESAQQAERQASEPAQRGQWIGPTVKPLEALVAPVQQDLNIKHTAPFESARVGDYNRGWNDCLFASSIAKEPKHSAQQPVGATDRLVGACQASDESKAKDAIMGAAYDFRDAHLSGSTNLKRSAHAALVGAVDAALNLASQPAQQQVAWYESVAELAAVYGEMCAINETKRDDQTPEQTARLAQLRAECVAIHKKRIGMLAAPTQPQQNKPVASIYISPGGEREFDDWKCELPAGRNILYASSEVPSITMDMARRFLEVALRNVHLVNERGPTSVEIEQGIQAMLAQASHPQSHPQPS